MEYKIYYSTPISIEMRQEIEELCIDVAGITQGFYFFEMFIEKKDQFHVNFLLKSRNDSIEFTECDSIFSSAIEKSKEKIYNKILTDLVLTST